VAITTAAAPAAPPRSTSRRSWGEHPLATAGALVAAWLLVILVTTVFHPDFLSGRTVLAIGFTMAITGIVSVGQGVLTASGALLDLSIPAGIMVPAWLVAVLVDSSNPPSVAFIVLIGVAVGLGWGLVNALIVTTLKLNPIIVTLGTNFIGIALLSMAFGNQSVFGRSALVTFANGRTGVIPNIWWVMLVVVVIGAVFLGFTRGGRRLMATGGSVTATRSRGISIRAMRFLAFGIAGACYGISGVLFAGSTSTFTANDSETYLLAVIAAVILAGIRLDGGRGNLLLIVPSVGLLATVQTALVFFGLNAAMQEVFQGGILIVALAVDGTFRRKATR
jgi:ribose/xylose/arabinose/galactoside ABC-type transport system permease subunit